MPLSRHRWEIDVDDEETDSRVTGEVTGTEGVSGTPPGTPGDAGDAGTPDAGMPCATPGGLQSPPVRSSVNLHR